MAEYDPSVAATVLGLSGFQLLQAWNANAPSLSDIRGAAPGDSGVRQRLHDADYLVGGWAVVMGIAYWVLTGKPTAFVILTIMFVMVSGWHHSVMNAEER